MRIGLCGTGGFAREVAPLAVAKATPDGVCHLAEEPGETELNGLPVLLQDDVAPDIAVSIPIADAVIRRRVAGEIASSATSSHWLPAYASTAIR
jgi:hypothetical protein